MQSKTLIFMHTHIINPCVLSEFKKILKAQNNNTKAVLFIHNTDGAVKDKSRKLIQEREFDGLKITCVLCYERTLRKFGLALNADYRVKVGAGECFWYNCDYSFYIIRHAFPNFDFYWQVQYDIYYNDKDYTSLLALYEDDKSDLLGSYFSKHGVDSQWCWIADTQWLYERDEIYGFLWTAPRMSARLVDRLYECRLAQNKAHKKLDPNTHRWAICELFAASECVKAGFSAAKLKNDKTSVDKEIDLNNTRLFENYDKCLYHPHKGDFLARLSKIQAGDEFQRLKDLEHFSGFVKFYIKKRLNHLKSWTQNKFYAKIKSHSRIKGYFRHLQIYTRCVRYPIKRFFKGLFGAK